MTLQREKDLEAAYARRLYESGRDSDSYATGFADAAHRIRLILASGMDEDDQLINLDILAMDLKKP